jgi:predicted aspartyl protease
MKLAASTTAPLARCRMVVLLMATGCVLSLSTTHVHAQGGVYTWTDENGVVHFSNSQVPPKHMASAELRANVPAPTPGQRRPVAATIPLINRDQKRFVRARLEGASASREVLMLVDTGAQMTMIDEPTAGELGAEFIEEAGIVGVSGMTAGWIGQLRRVQVGENEVRDWRVMVGPLPGVLLLGMDVLEHMRLSVSSDYLEAR